MSNGYIFGRNSRRSSNPTDIKRNLSGVRTLHDLPAPRPRTLQTYIGARPQSGRPTSVGSP